MKTFKKNKNISVIYLVLYYASPRSWTETLWHGQSCRIITQKHGALHQHKLTIDTLNFVTYYLTTFLHYYPSRFSHHHRLTATDKSYFSTSILFWLMDTLNNNPNNSFYIFEQWEQRNHDRLHVLYHIVRFWTRVQNLAIENKLDTQNIWIFSVECYQVFLLIILWTC